MSDTAITQHSARAPQDRLRQDRLAFERYHRTRATRHRDELVERFMPLAHKLAQRYSRGHQSLDDLTQVAAFGLVKAVERFDPARGVAFASYAVPTILGELKRYLRDHSWAVRPPRPLLERALQVGNAIAAFETEHSRSPTVAELATRLGDIDEEDVLEALQARRAASATSLQAPRRSENGDEETLGDGLGYEDLDFAAVEDQILLDALLATLPARERAVMRMRVVDDMTQADIGAVIGVSQMQVSRIIRQAIERMQATAAGHAIQLAA